MAKSNNGVLASVTSGLATLAKSKVKEATFTVAAQAVGIPYATLKNAANSGKINTKGNKVVIDDAFAIYAKSYRPRKRKVRAAATPKRKATVTRTPRKTRKARTPQAAPVNVEEPTVQEIVDDLSAQLSALQKALKKELEIANKVRAFVKEVVE